MQLRWLSKLRNSIQDRGINSGVDVTLLDNSEIVTLDQALAILSEAGRPFDCNYASDLFKVGTLIYPANLSNLVILSNTFIMNKLKNSVCFDSVL